MRDETNIRLVHAHPKRDGGHDAVQVTLPPVPLGPLQCLLVTSRVVHLAVELQILKRRRESFALVTGPGVNHADGPGISFLGLLRHRREVRQRDSLGTDVVPGLGADVVPVSHALATYDLVPQVGSVEGSRDEDGIFQPERFDNLVLDPRRGRRGERLEGHAGCYVVPEVLQREVRGPEVVAPAGDAVRLVDGDGRKAPVCRADSQGVFEPLGPEALRGCVQELDPRSTIVEIGAKVGVDPFHLSLVHCPAPRGGVDLQVVAAAKLVSKEREEGRHDDGDARCVLLRSPHRRKLVHHALAETRRERREAIALLLHQRSDGVQLCISQRCVRSDPGLEQRLQFFPEPAHLSISC